MPKLFQVRENAIIEEAADAIINLNLFAAVVSKVCEFKCGEVITPRSGNVFAYGDI